MWLRGPPFQLDNAYFSTYDKLIAVNSTIQQRAVGIPNAAPLLEALMLNACLVRRVAAVASRKRLRLLGGSVRFVREPNAEPIPGYRLIEPLGSGGFGEVWKCEAPGGLYKAIKFVYGNLNSLEGDAAGAEQEHKALQRVKEVRHPFVLSMDRIEVVD